MSELKSVDLVLEGGGVKGIGLLGAVLGLADAGYRFERIAGTSAGAIVAALVVAYQRAGRDLHDLEPMMRGLDYTRFADGAGLAKVAGKAGAAVEVVMHGGGHSGDYLTEWLGEALQDVGVSTFADLRIADPDSSLRDNQEYALVVHATDLSRRLLVRLPWDYPQYGKNPDDMRVVDAVRASMSIPFYFRPVQIETQSGTATWVDGGLLSNFPITVFDRSDGEEPRWPTWGIKLSRDAQGFGQDKPVRTGLRIAISSLHAMTADWNRYRYEEDGVTRRTLHVDTDGVSATDFDISAEKQQLLFTNGTLAVRSFLDKINLVPAG
ncbi:NTE family protein [Kibdelosporangium banguiense]|uniref:NTE family protein n=1 Tax=Kibdelosporangium banguiense TaxID=1365924 RepID=A0ABS4U106_9PSEU|nr:patatin-like phospholipase family protein [Kibdelosporangium banguiense]MBP2330337.1 NTE family protein [Kibdelosporangium banguiense]